MRTAVEQALTLHGVAALQSSEQRRTELAGDIVAAAHLRGRFHLGTGDTTEYYFDPVRFETKPTILRRLASLLAERVPADIDRLVGARAGATPVVTALALESGLPFAVVVPSDADDGARIDGELLPDERVVLVDDVIATGHSAVRAASQVRSLGADVVTVLAVIDRLEGGAEALAAEGFGLDPLLRVDELLAEHT